MPATTESNLSPHPRRRGRPKRSTTSKNEVTRGQSAGILCKRQLRHRAVDHLHLLRLAGSVIYIHNLYVHTHPRLLCLLLGDHLSGKPGMLRNFTAVREMSGILLKVREMSGKSCLKLFIVSCIFASIQLFNTSTGMIWVTLNTPSAANHQGIVREFHIVWRVVTLLLQHRTILIIFPLLCYSIVYYYNGAQRYEQLLQNLDTGPEKVLISVLVVLKNQFSVSCNAPMKHFL